MNGSYSILIAIAMITTFVLILILCGFSLLIVDLELAFFPETIELIGIIDKFEQLYLRQLAFLVLFPNLGIQLLDHVVRNFEILTVKIGLSLLAIIIVLIVIGLDALIVLVLAVQALQIRQTVEHLLPVVFYFTYFVSGQVQFNQVGIVFKLVHLLERAYLIIAYFKCC